MENLGDRLGDVFRAQHIMMNSALNKTLAGFPPRQHQLVDRGTYVEFTVEGGLLTIPVSGQYSIDDVVQALDALEDAACFVDVFSDPPEEFKLVEGGTHIEFSVGGIVLKIPVSYGRTVRDDSED